MASIYTTIRQLLETHLSNIEGIPVIAYENVDFKPTVGTPFVSCMMLPVSRRPAVRGLNPTQRYDGIFAVNCYSNEGYGPAGSDQTVDKILNAFDATTDIGSLSIDYSERDQGSVDTPWYIVPVNIGWHIYN